MTDGREAEKPDDIEGLDELATNLTLALGKVMRYDRQREHLKALSSSEDVSEKLSWESWPKPKLTVRFVKLPACKVREVRSHLEDGTIRVNAVHSDFILRLENGRSVGPRLVSYVAVLVASHYQAYMSGRPRDFPDTALRVSDSHVTLVCQLEEAVVRRIFAHP